jgi:hypothetical protein
MEQPGGEEEEQLFEQGFSQMAHNVLVSKFPDLVEKVVTFKTLETDLDDGAGVGAFVVQHGNSIIYVPVVMADNQLKPLDMFYNKDLNVFLPLSQEWLEEVGQLTLDEMGEAVQTPKTLRRDVDIRHLVIPPTTGRFAYAAARGDGTFDVNRDLLAMLKHTTAKAASAPPVLAKFLANAPNEIKEAFSNVVRSREKLATAVYRLYDFDEICASLTKTASARNSKGGALWVVGRDTPPETFKDIFGDRAPESFQGVLLKGYGYKDTRVDLNHAYQIQERLKLTTPQESGFYNVFTRQGKVEPAFILSNPRAVDGYYSPSQAAPEGRHGKRHDTLHHGEHNKGYLVIMNGGRSISKMYDASLVGEKLDGDGKSKESEIWNKLMNGTAGDTPNNGDYGVFIKKTGTGFVGTKPFTIKNVSTDAGGIRRISLNNFDENLLITDPAAAKAGLHRPKGSGITYIPTDARFIRLTRDQQESTDLFDNATDVTRWFYNKFDAMGAHNFTVKNAGAGQVSIDGRNNLTPVAAMTKLALDYHISFPEAETAVKKAMESTNNRIRINVLTPAQSMKIAQDPMMGGDPNAGAMPPGGDPAAAGMDPSAMGAAPPPPPSPPSPLDIAIGEKQTQLQQQSAGLQQQQMSIDQQAQLLSEIGARAQAIATGGAAAVQQGAPPAGMAPPGGAPPAGMAPPGGAQPAGMASPEDSPAGDPTAAMAGGMGGAPAGGMDPMAAGGSPQPGGPMDPMAQQQQQQPQAGGPGAMMATESPSAQEIQNQVNPQFLEQAAKLDDTGAFDAAAIASMAQSPSFQNMVTDYVPTLERALDNLGRILLTMWMQESELKQQIGEEQYVDMEDNIRAVFEGLGDLILTMNKNAIMLNDASTKL